MGNMKKAIIVEDFKLISDIWNTILVEEGFNEIEVMSDSVAVENKMKSYFPDLILMDVNLPSAKNGIQLTESLMKINPELKIIILTIHTEPSYIQRAFEAGAKGYVTKNSSIVELKQAINLVLSGETYLCNEVRQIANN
jgi:two-component system nitrate/nitrite response regulator NarL